jgi:hypothetical protein
VDCKFVTAGSLKCEKCADEKAGCYFDGVSRNGAKRRGDKRVTRMRANEARTETPGELSSELCVLRI